MEGLWEEEGVLWRCSGGVGRIESGEGMSR